jgi:hypothetical protein
LGVALYKQDKKGNKQRRAQFKTSKRSFKAQGNDGEALVAQQLWGMVFWGCSEKIVIIIHCVYQY